MRKFRIIPTPEKIVSRFDDTFTGSVINNHNHEVFKFTFRANGSMLLDFPQRDETGTQPYATQDEQNQIIEHLKGRAAQYFKIDYIWTN
jgi:hypothetical protein